jgi:hypothetical protein
LVTFHSKVP